MKERFFKLAKQAAKHSTHHTHKLGSVLVRKNRVLAFGFNTLKTHTRSNHPFKSMHAELSAVLNSGEQDLSNCDLYIYRERKDGTLALSKPCAYCRGLLKNQNIRTVYFTDNNKYNSERY